MFCSCISIFLAAALNFLPLSFFFLDYSFSSLSFEPYLLPFSVQLLSISSFATLLICLQNNHFWLFSCTHKWTSQVKISISDDSTSLVKKKKIIFKRIDRECQIFQHMNKKIRDEYPKVKAKHLNWTVPYFSSLLSDDCNVGTLHCPSYLWAEQPKWLRPQTYPRVSSPKADSWTQKHVLFLLVRWNITCTG